MIKLPKLFESVLATKPTLNSAVTQSFDLFEPWLEQSGMPFFPGFTDHSPRHISDVLNTAASLIADASHDLLVAEDIAILCIAALLHDCGMHLTQDGFRALIEDSDQPIVSGFNDQPWPQLWKDYVAEAKRFGQDKLLGIFGDTEPICVDEIDYENITERNCLLIGEFVRRHHARLAHEIAIKGVPSRSSEKLKLIGFDSDFSDIAGLIARSHGMSIRSTFPYIEERYSLLPEQRQVKGPFLMAVLRISDYVQVQSERALKSLLSVKELRSPISRQEWRNHFAVKDVSPWHDDPEAFFVNAAPTDAKTYLKLVKLFADIQRELDESWATIGEVYGRRGALSNLGLTLRRIRTNLDSPEKYAKTVPYLPIKACFDSSGSDLLKLLVGPLYDYEFATGVRELIQNAVDACREISDLLNSTDQIIESDNGEANVIVSIEENEDGSGWVTVTDTGVGMTLDTVTKYFLVAGASFRNSDLWKRQHLDESGQARVIRGGRFGVGALAAFLLGEEIQVRTRHFFRPESDGLEFRARIDDPNIEIRRCIAPSGTSLKIWVSDPDVIDSLRPGYYHQVKGNKGTDMLLDSWEEVDWFVQEFPKVKYRWSGYYDPKTSVGRRTRFSAVYFPKKKDCVPMPGTTDPSWERLPNAAPYKDIYWRFTTPVNDPNEDSTLTVVPNEEITVNGIRVQIVTTGNYYDGRLEITSDNHENGLEYVINRPSLAIFDPAGVCPINLQRSSVSFERMGMDSLLAKSVLNKHLCGLVKQAQSTRTFSQFRIFCTELSNSKDVIYSGLCSPICATSRGIYLSTPSVFAEQRIRTVYFVSCIEVEIQNSNLADTLLDDEAVIFRNVAAGKQNYLAWLRGVLPENAPRNFYSKSAKFPCLKNDSTISLLRDANWRFASEKGRISQIILEPLESTASENNYMEIIAGNTKKAKALVQRCKDIIRILGKDAEIVAWTLDNEQPHTEAKSQLIETLISITGGKFLAEFAPKALK